MEIKQDELVLCTVTKIEGTTVFVNIEDHNAQGSIVFSEIAAGRIRNIREYVVPNKKIVCKVIKIYPDHVELSFRRVTGTERDSVIQKFKQEQTFKPMLKTIVKNPESIIAKIKEKMTIPEFLLQIKEDPKIISEFFNKEEAEKLKKILSEKKEKEKISKRSFTLRSDSNTGITDIKEILNTNNDKNTEISYLGSSQFTISCKGKDFKEANTKLLSNLEEITKRAKSKKAILEVQEK